MTSNARKDIRALLRSKIAVATLIASLLALLLVCALLSMGAVAAALTVSVVALLVLLTTAMLLGQVRETRARAASNLMMNRLSRIETAVARAEWRSGQQHAKVIEVLEANDLSTSLSMLDSRANERDLLILGELKRVDLLEQASEQRSYDIRRAVADMGATVNLLQESAAAEATAIRRHHEIKSLLRERVAAERKRSEQLANVDSTLQRIDRVNDARPMQSDVERILVNIIRRSAKDDSL